MPCPASEEIHFKTFSHRFPEGCLLLATKETCKCFFPDHVWYDSVPIGHNTLKTKMKEIFELAGLKSEAMSNHSFRATGISRLYVVGGPDKLIMERSGHLSAEGVHSYKWNTVQQEKAVLSLLSSPNKLLEML